MKKILLMVSLLVCGGLSYAQEVQWAFKVLDYSSQKEAKAYSAKQVLGKPNVLPGSGERPNAWQPKGHKEEFIKVGFLTPIIPKQIIIAESYHPGYISKVFVYDASGKEVQVVELKPKGSEEGSRLFSVNASEINFYVVGVKVVLSPEKDIPVAIDAIGITESTKPYKIKLNQADIIKANMIVTKLDKTVNSIYPEFGPLLSPDGKTLYFSRRFDPANMGGTKDLEDIWYADWDDKNQKWGEAKNMGIPLNNKEPNFINSISPDGNTILLGNSYHPDGTMGGGASISYRTASGWSFPQTLLIEDDQNINEKTNYYLSNSQKTLLMSVERKKDTYGSRDLYVSFWQPDSTWSKPLNLGPTINTVGTESAPFLAGDDHTLYFASNGFAGYGGTDIYVTRRLDDSWTKWSEPENLGPIINTAFDESYFTISAKGDKVYYTSQGETSDDVDIYTLSPPKIIRPLPVVYVKGRVLDSKTNEPLPMAKVLFENLATGAEMGVARSSPGTGEFSLVLPYGNNYGYLAEKAGYISVHASMDLAGLTEYAEIRKDLYLTPIDTGETIVLNNVFFDFDKYELKKESHSELNRVVKLLIDNPKVKIEVSGHTDNIGLESYNDHLSYNRAKAVVTYLIANAKIESDRIVLHHYGALKPIADNATAWGRHLNRRVEFKILSK